MNYLSQIRAALRAANRSNGPLAAGNRSPPKIEDISYRRTKATTDFTKGSHGSH